MTASPKNKTAPERTRFRRRNEHPPVPFAAVPPPCAAERRKTKHIVRLGETHHAQETGCRGEGSFILSPGRDDDRSRCSDRPDSCCKNAGRARRCRAGVGTVR